MGLLGFCSALASSFGTGAMSKFALFGGISTYREEDNHRFYRILAIRCTVDFALNVKSTFGSYKMLQIAIQSRGHFHFAVKGTY